MINKRMCEVQGKMVELFPIGELGKAIGRSSVTLRKWEQMGVIPRTYRDNSGRRMYTAGQIKATRRILAEENLNSGRSVMKSQFKQRLVEAFDNLREKGDDYYDKETDSAGSTAISQGKV
jgi:hypothetical protein